MTMDRKKAVSFIAFSKNPDLKDELKSIDNDSLDEQERIRYQQDTHYRSILSWWVIIVVSIWILVTIIISLLEGLEILKLSVTAFSTLLATTTANILGLAYIVLKGMFPSKTN